MTTRSELIRKLVKQTNATLQKSGSLGRVDVGSDIGYIEIERIPTGIFGLDFVLGGGLPRRLVTQFWGEYSTGKTTSMLKAIRHAQEYTDATTVLAVSESFNKDWARSLGLLIPYTEEELERLADAYGQEVADDQESDQEAYPEFVLIQHAHGDALLELFTHHVKSGLFDIAALDSLGAIQRHRNLEGSLEDENYGGNSSLLSSFSKKIHSAQSLRYDPKTMVPSNADGCVPSRTAVLLINQAREKIGGYNPTGQKLLKYNGGEAAKHMFDVSVQFKKGPLYTRKHNTKTVTYAQEVRCKSDKNKTAPPFREAEWDFYFETHEDFRRGDVDTVKELFAWGTYFEVIVREGSYYTVASERVKSKEAALEVLRTSASAQEAVYAGCMEAASRV